MSIITALTTGVVFSLFPFSFFFPFPLSPLFLSACASHERFCCLHRQSFSQWPDPLQKLHLSLEVEDEDTFLIVLTPGDEPWHSSSESM